MAKLFRYRTMLPYLVSLVLKLCMFIGFLPPLSMTNTQAYTITIRAVPRFFSFDHDDVLEGMFKVTEKVTAAIYCVRNMRLIIKKMVAETATQGYLLPCVPLTALAESHG